jgi:hypothetical protein
MGPADISDMSSTSNNQIQSLPKLRGDSSNWATYSERVLNYLTSKGLRRHVLGTARKPEELDERNGSFYKRNSLAPLTDEEVEKHEEAQDNYDQMQAAVREVIYRTVDNTTFLQVKNESDAAAMWKKVASIHADKGSLYETNLLMQLQNTRYAEGESMRDHIAKMTELRERLAEMNTPVSDESFVSYLRTSLSLAPSFRTLFTTLSATAHQMGKKLTPTDVIWHLTEEATSAEIEDSINKSNAAMLTATSKAKGGNSRSSKNDILCTNTNCGRRGHTKDQCWAKGGGREGQAPDWWKTGGKQASASIAESTPTSDEPENYAMLTYNVPDDPTALVCTSDFRSEAHAISKHTGTILDSGASRHFSPDRSKFLNYQELINPEPIRAADGRTFSALGKGDVQVELPNGDQKPTPITLKNAYYSPHMAFTLMSVSCIDRAGYSLYIQGGTCVIRSPKSNVIGRIPEVRGLYRVGDFPVSAHTHVASAAIKQISVSELHRRMGHVNHDDLRHMVEKGMVTGVNLDMSSKPEFCEACIKAKATRKPFPKESKTEHKSYGDKVVSDVWGPASVQSIGGKRYYTLFQDLHTHEEVVSFLRQKSETFAEYKKYEAWVKVQRNALIRIFGCDRGGEFTSREFSKHLENAGTVRHLTIHDSPASNGAAERANRTHVEGARAMMEAAGLPKNLWAEAVRHHVWIRNRVPSRTLPEMKTPHEMGTGEKPDLSAVHAWGTKAWVKRLNAGKLKSRAEEGRFVGIDSESKGYRIYWPGKNRVSVERDVYFNENEALAPEEVPIEGEYEIFTNSDLPLPSNTSEIIPEPSPPVENVPHTTNETPEPENIENATENPSVIPSDVAKTYQNSDAIKATQSTQIPAPHQRSVRRNSLQGLPQFEETQYGRGKRERVATSRANAGVADFEGAFMVEEESSLEPGGVELNIDEAEWFGQIMEQAMVISEDEPSLAEVLGGDERSAWTDAIDAELIQMEKVNAWIPVIPPRDANIIPSCYVFRRKRNETGNIVRYKARLVIKGFKQQFGVDYIETFAPTVRAPTLRILLSFAAQKGATVHHCDVKNAYLNSRLQDDIILYSELPPKYSQFRELPPGLKDKPNVVCKWLVSVYGSKQGAHNWYAEVKKFFTDLGYSVSIADEAVFYKFDGDKYTIVAAATDDFTVIADSSKSANHLIQKQLTERFEISDLGTINWLLGVNITRDINARTISLGQQAYIEQILSRFGLENARTAVTPMEVGLDLSPGSPHLSATLLTPAEKTKYREMIGCLMYATVMTCPDIAFAVSTLSQYLDAPHTTHLQAVTRIFRYLSGTKDLKLVLGGPYSAITGYSDADWASQLHCHSISGFAFFVGNGVVSWSSKKQPIITLSSTEAEYVALTHSSKDIIWIHKLLTEFSSIFLFTVPTTLYCDNQGAIRLSKDSTFHGRTKHINIHFHFIRQTVSHGHITLEYCPTADMIADAFTKPLARVKFETFRSLLGLI